MAQSPSRRSSRHPAAPGRGAKRRVLELAGGEKLVLRADRSIDHVATDGTTTSTWTPADDEWAQHALRFGLRPQDRTVTPPGRYVEGSKPPRR